MKKHHFGHFNKAGRFPKISGFKRHLMSKKSTILREPTLKSLYHHMHYMKTQYYSETLVWSVPKLIAIQIKKSPLFSATVC